MLAKKPKPKPISNLIYLIDDPEMSNPWASTRDFWRNDPKCMGTYVRYDQSLFETEREGCVGWMTPSRVVYFLERFKKDEKMLGPHEQWALDVAIETMRKFDER